MKIKLILALCLFFNLNFSLAQKAMRKPFLLIENKQTGKHYTIKPNTKIFLKTKSDSTIHKVKYKGIASPSSIYIQDHQTVNLSEIDYLSFKPYGYERTSKHIVYGAGLALTITSAILLIQQTQAPQVEGAGAGITAAWASMLITPPLTILSAYLVGNIVHGITPYYSLSQGETYTLKIVTE